MELRTYKVEYCPYCKDPIEIDDEIKTAKNKVYHKWCHTQMNNYSEE